MSTEGSSMNPTDIAIVGMAVRVPGARDHREFWANLRDGIESIRTYPTEDLLTAGESPDRIRKKNYVPRGADLGGMELFDADFFGFSPKEAAIMDPQHRHFLECTWEAFEDAARPPERISGPVGVFAGSGMGSYFYFNVCSHRDLVDDVGMFLLRHTGNDKDFLATRVSYLFDLHGPSLNIQTACSTSLVAVHAACQSLLTHECDMAIAGGVTIEIPHRRGYLHHDGEVLSVDGHCRAFDANATGTVFGSGVGVVVLRRLADAIADGDPIRAVIKATAINNDGASKAGYLAPSVSGQAEAVVEAHTLAGISADAVQYIECHGTGTNLGDPIEIEALTAAFRRSTQRAAFCRIGSVKTNIGHLDTAAGVVGLIKTVLALQHKQMPPSLNFEKPNPAIAFASTPFVVNDRLTTWPRGTSPRLAAVNSLGVGGTNAHVIVEEAPEAETGRSHADVGPQVLVLTGKTRQAVDSAAERLAAHLEAVPQDTLQDVACTLITGRRHFEHRRIVAVADRKDAIDVLRQTGSSRFMTHSTIDRTSGPVLLFPGGGAQYPAMAATLYRKDPAFAAIVDEGISYLPADAAARIRQVWLNASRHDRDAAQQLLRPSLQLPAILILEIALARLWMSWGVKPAALIGHSMGENAAACISGVLDFKAVVNLVHLRGTLFEELAGGAMLSVSLPLDELRRRLPADLDMAVNNAPDLGVVSGPVAAIDAFAAELAAEEIEHSKVPISVAAHSRMLEPILSRFESYLRSIRLARPQIALISNVSGTWMTDAQATDPEYWVSHLRSTVRFSEGLATLAEDPTRIYIEVGPGRTMSSLVKSQGKADGNQIINSLPHADDDKDDRLSFLTALGRAWALGLPVPLERSWQGTGARRVALPAYPFQGQPYFIERVSTASAESEAAELTKRSDIATWGWRPIWKRAYADVCATSTTPEKILVFLDDTGLGARIVSRLQAEGHAVATVMFGDAFVERSDVQFVLCPERGREGYDALVASLAQSGHLPTRIVHAWLLTGDEAPRPGSSFFDQNQERGFYSLFYLAQALSNIELKSPMHITVLANGMQRVLDGPLLYPDKATVLGPVQVIPREMPLISVSSIDLPQTKPDERGAPSVRQRLLKSLGGSLVSDDNWADEILDLIWDDIVAARTNEVLAVRRGKRFARMHQETPLELSDDAKPPFREKGVYLVTGGVGGIALACAEKLASDFRAKLVLVGRLDIPARAEWPAYLEAYGDQDRLGHVMQAIQNIEQAGGEVMYARADVTNPEAMRRVVADAQARFGAIHGVLHAAGIVKDELIALKSQSDVEDVLAPKVLGAMVLEQVLKDVPLDVVVLFSSTSTDMAPAGQCDYVAANAYLNAFAESRWAAEAGRAVAVHWGVWNGVGMAARAVKSAQDHAEAPVVKSATQPLFDRHVRSPDDSWLELQCNAKSDWILNEHRLASGEAIWPGTGYLELVAEAARELGQSHALLIEDLTFRRPLAAPDDAPVYLRVRYRNEPKQARLTLESRIGHGTDEPWVAHAEAKIMLGSLKPSKLLDIASIASRCGVVTLGDGVSVIASAQEQHLRFGPRWQVLRSARFGDGEALARTRARRRLRR